MSRRSESFSGTGDWLMGAVSRNPEGLLLLAAGAALLLRGTAARGGSRPSGRRAQPGEAGETMRESDGGWSEGVSRTARSARDYASEVGGRVSDVTGRVAETATSYAAAAGDYATETGRAVTEQSRRYAQKAQSTLSDTVGHVVQEQPLAVALAGLAAGAAVAAAFPATELERRTLGPAGEKLTGLAGETRERLRDATYAAGERLVDTVEERGLSSDGLKDVARDVAGSFGSAFSGEDEEGTAGRAGARPPGKPGGKRGSDI